MDKIEENIRLSIARLFQGKIIKSKKGRIILDIDELISFDSKIYEMMITNSNLFLKILKEETLERELPPIIYFKNWKDNIDISSIRIKDINRLVKVDGMVNRITDPLALVVGKRFECPSCGTSLTTNGQTPKRCMCGNKDFFKEISIEYSDMRECIIEELQERTRGKTPQKIRIRLKDELTNIEFSDILKPGNRVSIIGIIESIPINKTQQKNEDEIQQYRIVAKSVSHLEEKFDDDISEEDMKNIGEIGGNNPVERLINSIAPSIYDMNEFKRILLLQMVGGVPKELPSGRRTRYWINVMCISPPSFGKTSLAQECIARCPGSGYFSGDNSTGCGIVGSVVKDELLGSYAIDVGPLVKYSGSVLFGDEIDKMKKEYLDVLHTPLELGVVKINKANVDGTFNAETALCALENPKFGIFDDTKPITEQIDLPPAILSRMDIIYIIKDNINKDLDDKITEAIYNRTKRKQDDNIIPIPLFRKYITYARNLRPYLTPDLLKDLQDFYNKVRNQSSNKNSNMRGIPIGTRHFEGLLRLSEAFAKLNLREHVAKEDIKNAMDLFYNSLVKLGMDESTGIPIIDMGRLGEGKTIAQRKLRDIIIDELRTLKADNIKPLDKELKELIKIKIPNMSEDDYYKTIDMINREGTIIREDGKWKLT